MPGDARQVDTAGSSGSDVPIVLIGGGGHARVVAYSGRESGMGVLGFADDDPGASVEGLAHLGGIDDVLSDGRYAGVGVILSMGPSSARTRLMVRLSGCALATVVHPSSVLSRRAAIGGGVYVGPGAVVNAGARICAHAIVNSGAVIEHECELGEGSHACPRSCAGGGARLGERSVLGTGAVVLPGVTLGSDAVAGAMTLVNRDVPSGETVVGVPARALARGA